MAELSVRAGLIKLEEEDRVAKSANGYSMQRKETS
jgi:hypothetical protein